MIIVNGFQPLAIITKHSILDIAAALDLPLIIVFNLLFLYFNFNCIFLGYTEEI